MNNPSRIKTLLLISALVLFAAIIPIWPYGLYALLRFLICGVAIYSVYALRQTKSLTQHKIPLIVLAVLFNPLVPIPLPRQLWQIIDFAAGVYFFILRYGVKKEGRIGS